MILIESSFIDTTVSIVDETPQNLIVIESNFIGGGGGGGTWGSITGTLSNQTDLQSALDAKVPYSGATGNVTLGEYGLTTGYSQFDTTPTQAGGVGRLIWNDTDGTLNLGLKGGNVTLQIGQEEVVRVVNKTGSSLNESAYQVVRVSTAQGQRLGVALAQGNNDANSADTLGIVTETIANNQEGFITVSGLVNNINTTGSLQGETWADGDLLFLSPTTPGAITNVRPVAPNHTVILGYVVYAHATQGKIYVKVDNGYELGELHDVYVPSPSNNDGIFWNSTNLRYENKSVTSALGYTPISGTGVAGQVSYWSGTNTQAGSNNLFWDNTNSRLGINTTSPLSSFDVIGEINVRNTTSGWGVSSANQSRFLTISSYTDLTNHNFGIAKRYNINGALLYNATDWANGNTPNYITATKRNATAGAFFFVMDGYGGSPGFHWYAPTDLTSSDSYSRMFLRHTGELSIGVNGGFGGSLTVRGNSSSTGNVFLLQNSTPSDLFAVANNGGDTAIGTGTFATATKLTVGGSETAASAIARGQLINTSLIASANNDFLIGADITPTFTNGAFTGVTNLALRATGRVTFQGSVTGTGNLSNYTVTASGALAASKRITSTLVAAANNDVLVGLDIAPTYTNGAFTGVRNIALRLQSALSLANSLWHVSNDNANRFYFDPSGRTFFGSQNGYEFKNSGSATALVTLSDAGTLAVNASPNASYKFQVTGATFLNGTTRMGSNVWIVSDDSIERIYFETNSHTYYKTGASHIWRNSTNTQLMTLPSTGNLLIGTATDSGFKLDVAGNTQITGSSSSTGNALTVRNSTPTTLFSVGNNGTSTFNNRINLNVTSSTLTRETLFKGSVNDDSNSGFYINNGTIADSLFVPSFGGFANSQTTYSLGFTGFIDSTNDASDSATFGLIDLGASRTSTTSDPYNGTLTSVQNRKILTIRNNTTVYFTVAASGNITYFDGGNFILGTTTGTKIGTATTQKIGFWNATPIVQPTTAVAAATFVANTSLIANDTATFDGYTIGQVVKALRNTGILA